MANLPPGIQGRKDSSGSNLGLSYPDGSPYNGMKNGVTALQRIVGGDASLTGATVFSNATATGVGYAVDIQRTAPAMFRGVRALFENFDVANPLTINKFGFAVTPNVTVEAGTGKYLNGPDGSGLAWTPGTAGGLSTLTIPVATAGLNGNANSIQPSHAFSDFAPVQAVARADGSPLPFLRTRAHMPDGAILLAVNAAGVTETVKQSNAAITGGHFSLMYRSASIAAANLFTASLQPQYYGHPANPVGIIYYTDQMMRTLLACGDSRTQGTGSITGFNGWPNRLDAKYGIIAGANGLVYSAMNKGVSGQMLESSLANCRNLCAQFKPHYASIFAWSPNSAKLVGIVGASAAQQNMDALWAQVLYTIEYLQQLGITPIVMTSPSDDSYASVDSVLVKAQNARVMALPASVLKVDVYTLLTDPATANTNLPKFNPLYRSPNWPTDGTHWNDAAHLATADAVQAVIR